MECVICYSCDEEKDNPLFKCSHIHHICEDCAFMLCESHERNKNWQIDLRCPLCRAELINFDIIYELFIDSDYFVQKKFILFFFI